MDIAFPISVLFAVLAILITYTTGHVVVSFIKISERLKFLKEFSKLCSGVFAISTLYALFRTTGFTINVIILGIFLFFIVWLKTTNRLNGIREAFLKIISEFSFSSVLIQVILVILFVFFLFVKIKNPFTGVQYEVYGDYYNYAKIIEHLNKTGVEGCYLDWFTGLTPKRNLYHFGELWYAAFFTKLFHQTPFYTFYFQVFPIVLVVYVFGGLALIESLINPKRTSIYLFAIVLLFSCGISFYIPRENLFTRGDWNDLSLLYQPKYFYASIFIIYSLLFVFYKKTIPIILLGLTVILTSTVTAPSVLMIITLWIFYQFLQREITLKQVLKYSIPILLFLLSFSGYVLIMGHVNTNNEISNSIAVNDSSQALILVNYFKTAFNCFAGQLIKSVFSLLPYLLLLLYMYIRKLENNRKLYLLMLYLGVFNIVAILSYSIFHFIGVDAVQLWTIVYIPLSAILCFLILINGLTTNNLFAKLMAVFMIALSFKQANPFMRYEELNLKFVQKIKEVYNGGVTVFFKGADDYTSLYSKNINMYVPAEYIVMDYKNYYPVCLNVYDIPKSDVPLLRNMEDGFIHYSIFNTFVQLQKRYNEYASIEQSQKDFMEQYNVKYVFKYKNAVLPEFISSRVRASFEEENEGITVYVLD